MILSKKCILLISPEPWNHIHISKHHYAIELSKQENIVYFLGPPSDKYQVEKTSFNNLYHLQYKGFPTGVRFYPKFLREKIQRRVIHKLEKITSNKFDVIWSFDNSVFFDFTKSTKCLNISHIVDFSQDFSFTSASKSSDVNFAISRNILSKQLLNNHNSYKIEHAIDDLFFDDSLRTTKVELPGTNQIKAITFGNLNSKYLDWNLAESIYNEFADIDFIHIGPFEKDIVVANNVFFLGPRQKTYLPAVMQAADILFIFYDYENNKDQLTNSHKILEYLSSGKPIVCNPFSDYSEKDLLFQCEVKNDFINKIKTLKNNPEEMEVIQRRIDFARKNTYSQRLNEIEIILNECI